MTVLPMTNRNRNNIVLIYNGSDMDMPQFMSGNIQEKRGQFIKKKEE